MITLLKAQAATESKTAIVGGLSFLSFIIFPLLGFYLGSTTGGWEYRRGYLSVKVEVISWYKAYLAKALALCLTIMAFLLTISLILPGAVGVFQYFIGEARSVVTPAELFEITVGEISPASLSGTLLAFCCATFITCVFAMIGLLLGEMNKGRADIMAVFVALYFLAPLGNFLDPRNIFAALGKKYLWFGTSFNPYALNLDLLSPLLAFAVLMIMAVLSVTLAGYLREKRLANLNFLRTQN